MSVTTNRFIGLQKFWKLFLILSIIGVIISGIFWIKDFYQQQSFVNLHFEIDTLPKDVNIGMQVTYRGIDVGKIQNVRFNEDLTSIIVDIRLLRRIVSEMKSDSEIRIVPSLVGKPDIILDLGGSSQKFDSSQYVRVRAEKAIEVIAREQVKVFSEKLDAIIPNIDSIIANTAKLTNEAQKIDFGKVNTLITSVNSTMIQVNSLVTEVAGLQGNIRSMAVNLDATFVETKKLLKGANKVTSSIFGDNDEFAKSIKGLVLNLEDLSGKLALMSGRMEGILTTYDATGKNINELTESLKDENNGVPALVLKVNELADDADIVAKALQEHWLLKGNAAKVKERSGKKSPEDILREKQREREERRKKPETVQ